MGITNTDKEHNTIIIKNILPNATFLQVDIKNLDITITQTEFDIIDQWKLKYWSRSTGAWHNWMAVEAKLEK